MMKSIVLVAAIVLSSSALANSDAQRSLTVGEEVVWKNKVVTVTGADSNSYRVREENNPRLIISVNREELSVKSGCNLDLCVNDWIVDTRINQYSVVYALSFDNSYVTMPADGTWKIYSHVERNEIAVTKGCVEAKRKKICVNDYVLTAQNRLAGLAAIQPDGKVVISDVSRNLTSNIDPESLTLFE